MCCPNNHKSHGLLPETLVKTAERPQKRSRQGKRLSRHVILLWFAFQLPEVYNVQDPAICEVLDNPSLVAWCKTRALAAQSE